MGWEWALIAVARSLGLTGSRVQYWGTAQALVIILPSISSVTLQTYIFLFTPQFSTLQNGDKIVPTIAGRLDFKMHVQVVGTAPGFHKPSVAIRYYHEIF